MSFETKLDQVDAFISVGDTDSALKLLNKTSRQAKTAMQRLGIYRRYFQLGSFDLAEKCLVRGIKKLPDNPEIRAVYTWFLYQQDRIQEAYESAELLAGTPYVSILAEFKMKQAILTPDTDFLSEDFASLYSDAYVSSKQQEWLRNAAVVSVLEGNYTTAFDYRPKEAVEAPFFWAMVAYDARRYNAALNYLSGMSNLNTETWALMADSYFILGDYESAQQLCQSALNSSQTLLPQMYFNAARYARLSQDWEGEYNLLNLLVQAYPNYLPGADSYANFALRCLNIPQEDSLALALRNTQMRSEGMKKYDQMPKVTIEEALDVFRKQGDVEFKALEFAYETNNLVAKDMLPEEKIAKIWLLLEKYTVEGSYPFALVEQAIHLLLNQLNENEARTLFDSYLRSAYGSDSYADLMQTLTPRECEYAAYFAAIGAGKPQDLALSFFIYGWLTEDKREHFLNLASSPQYQPSVSVLVNLAELYAGKRTFSVAEELYAQAIGISVEQKERSEILYRLANLQYETGNKESALVSLDYCLSINSSHAKARILRNKISSSR